VVENIIKIGYVDGLLDVSTWGDLNFKIYDFFGAALLATHRHGNVRHFHVRS